MPTEQPTRPGSAPDLTAVTTEQPYRHGSTPEPAAVTTDQLYRPGSTREPAAVTTEQPYRPGSAEDFDRLYRESYKRLLYTLMGVLRDRAAAEDCVQETFVRGFAAWSRWKPDAPAEAWLHRIALRVASSHRRHERLREVGETIRRLGRPAAAAPGTDAALSLDLLSALRRLPPQQAFVIMLRHHHGYSNREIATGLGLPESTIASRLAAAKARLRLDLGSAVEGDQVDLPMTAEG